MTKRRWFEEYRCGCVSEIVDRKKDLLGYCGLHGEDRRHIHPVFPAVERKKCRAAPAEGETE